MVSMLRCTERIKWQSLILSEVQQDRKIQKKNASFEIMHRFLQFGRDTYVNIPKMINVFEYKLFFSGSFISQKSICNLVILKQ